MKLSDQITRRQLFVAFGTSQQTGSLSSVDLAATSDASAVTLSASDGSVAPVTGADASNAGVMTAADKVRLDGLPPTTVRDFDSFSEVPGAAVAGAITHLRTAGHATGADGGGGLYRRVLAEPAHAGKVQSADGSWWELVPDTVGVSVHQFGAKGDDATDDTSAIQSAIDYAVSQGHTLWLRRNKTYRVTNLTVAAANGFTMRAAGGAGDQLPTTAVARLAYHGAAGSTLLYLHGVERGLIEGVTFEYGSAAPDAYIKTNYNTGVSVPSTTVRLENVYIFGNGKADGSIGFDMGPDSTSNDADHDWGRVEFRNIQTGWRFNHDQNVGYYANYLRGVGAGTVVDIFKGGNLKIGTLNCTNNDLDVRMRGGGSTSGTLTIDNAHVEWSTANASAVFLDVASSAADPITVVLNNPIVQNNYTGTFMKIGQAATVICNGGHLLGADMNLSGTIDGGDALFVMFGGIYDGTFTANDYGYYEQRWPSINPGNNLDPYGNSYTTRTGRMIGFDRIKMKAATRNYTTMPLSRPGGATVRRTFPVGALITGIEFVIETNAAVGLNDFGRFEVAGVNVAEIAIRDNGARKIGWTANDLQANDVDNVPLGDPTVTTAFAASPLVDWKYHGGELADVKSATGHIIVEWIDTGIGLTGSDP